ncbi:ArnT family glycosyltransferase [Limnoglobus roseus]|uniref:Phospholipid carrier-dependent glycosyltransferase n=1 Tax=Limnoglobus roseus TaxID=2598579 RepID=A0A5C1A727_9BACT|nr:glycosyltransferase family 39 protein [Limnoglobus roseus]QEL13642.1 phospholipid carrier-dependent glycosyltransferase [Limnoglobus roseus]
MDRPTPVTKFDLLWLAVFGGLSSLACVLAWDRVGVTYDESFYLLYGRECWKQGTCAPLTIYGTMPLPIEVETALPQLLNWRADTPLTEVILGSLRLARAGNLVFWWLLLVHTFLLGRAVGGNWAGRLAVAFLAVDPNWQAHAALATTDIAVSAMVVALAYHTLASRRRRWWVRVLLPGTLFGLAVLTKLSGLLYGGLTLAVIDLWQRFGPADDGPRPFRGRAMLAFVGLLTARTLIGLLVAAVYCGYDTNPARTALHLREMVPDEPTAFDLWRARNSDHLPNFAVAVLFQEYMNSRIGGSYLFGAWHPHGVWYYNPAVVAMKLPDALLLVGLFVLVIRPWSLLNLPAALAVVLFVFSVLSKRQIGVRLLFPPLALGEIGLAVALVRGWGRRGVGVGWVAAIVTGIVALWVWPNGLSYMNQLSGGPGRAYRRMADSNVDWGQGIPELIRWHDQHDRPATALWYFGTDPRAHGPRFRVIDLKENPVGSVSELKAMLGPTFLAVGHSEAATSPTKPPVKQDILDWLAGQQPVDRTSTFLIYDLRLAK